ncbi:MAG: radical SAM protein, partial [Elusimicrobia bacterium]|nr:radical SAM protein [Elusimicrobiota bacterium]
MITSALNLANLLFLRKNPAYLINFVTERCNASCPHCFLKFDKKTEEMRLEEYEKIASSCGKNLQMVALTGGEPFLRDDLFEIADIWYSNAKLKYISVTTNGSMPDKIENFARRAQERKMPAGIFFSYDFIGEKFSQNRNLKDLHLNVIKSYKAVKKFPKLDTGFSITVSPQNAENAVEVYRYLLNEIGVKNINIILLRGEQACALDAVSKQNIAKAYKNIWACRNKDFDENVLKGFSARPLISLAVNAKNKIANKHILDTFVNDKYIAPCFAGSLLGVIYADGDVAPCELLADKIGNLKDFNYNFADLWRSPAAYALRSKIKKTKCHCTFECAWSVNILGNLKFYPRIFYE